MALPDPLVNIKGKRTKDNGQRKTKHCSPLPVPRSLVITIISVLITTPVLAQTFTARNSKDEIHIKDLQPNSVYQLTTRGNIRERTVQADDCGIVTFRNTKNYPIVVNGNYFDIYFPQQDYWYSWTETTNIPLLKCKKVGNQFTVEGDLYQALDGSGIQSFVVTPSIVQIYHPSKIAPYSRNKVIWYGEWEGNNYKGVENTRAIRSNDCGLAKFSVKNFIRNAWNFVQGEFTFSLNSTNFDPATVPENNNPPVCKDGILYEKRD